jgi:hypothetical protein
MKESAWAEMNRKTKYQKESLKKLDNTQSGQPWNQRKHESKGDAGDDRKQDTPMLRQSTPAGQYLQDWPLTMLPPKSLNREIVGLLYSNF